MANRYGEAALMATRHVPSGDISPVARWESAMEKLYPTSAAARKKGCPRGAFLGLGEEGLVMGIPAGPYKASREDKAYAVRAVALLGGAFSTGDGWLLPIRPEQRRQDRTLPLLCRWQLRYKRTPLVMILANCWCSIFTQ